MDNTSIDRMDLCVVSVRFLIILAYCGVMKVFLNERDKNEKFVTHFEDVIWTIWMPGEQDHRMRNVWTVVFSSKR